MLHEVLSKKDSFKIGKISLLSKEPKLVDDDLLTFPSSSIDYFNNSLLDQQNKSPEFNNVSLSKSNSLNDLSNSDVFSLLIQNSKSQISASTLLKPLEDINSPSATCNKSSTSILKTPIADVCKTGVTEVNTPNIHFSNLTTSSQSSDLIHPSYNLNQEINSPVLRKKPSSVSVLTEILPDLHVDVDKEIESFNLDLNITETSSEFNFLRLVHNYAIELNNANSISDEMSFASNVTLESRLNEPDIKSATFEFNF